MEEPRIGLLLAGKIAPANINEQILVQSYKDALAGIGLIKSYYSIPEVEQLTVEDMDSFVLGYGYGMRIREFATVERETIPDDSLI